MNDHPHMTLLVDPAARTVDVGGRNLSMSCRGSGAPTIVLETGLGAESAEWAAVEQGVEPFARVFRYDRAGRGDSDRASHPRTAYDMVRDLHVLLRRAKIPGPYLLVGHSFGGLLARLFTYMHRSEVAGLILVDSLHEDQFEIFGPRFPPPSPNDPPGLQQTRTFWTTGWRDPASTTEGIDFPASIAQGREIESFGDLPLCVLTAGTFLNQSLIPLGRREPLQELWDEMQTRFTRLSSNVQQVYVPSSGHFLQREQPQVVIDAIARMVASVRRSAKP